MYVYYAHVFWKALWVSALTFNLSAKHNVAILSSSLLEQAHRTSPSSGHASTNSRLPFENPCLPLKGGVGGKGEGIGANSRSMVIIVR